MAKAAKAKRKAPTKTCPKCNTAVHARTKECPSCKYVFPVKAKTSAKRVSKAGTNGRRKRASANGAVDVQAVLSVQSLINKHGAKELRSIIDQIENAKVPF